MEKQCWCCLYYTVKGLSDLARWIYWLACRRQFCLRALGWGL